VATGWGKALRQRQALPLGVIVATVVALMLPLSASSVDWTCQVTVPTRDSANEVSNAGARNFNYGNALLRVRLWPNGTLVAGRLPDGGFFATINADGSISAKLGWWRGRPGKVVISGRRLDARAPRLRFRASSGYGDEGFQPSILRFPTVGCWQVTGRLVESDSDSVVAKVRFVVRVRKL
jgi:hypothetical protein